MTVDVVGATQNVNYIAGDGDRRRQSPPSSTAFCIISVVLTQYHVVHAD